MWNDDDIYDAQQEAAREEYEMQLREQFIPEMYEEFARDLMSGKDHLYDEVIEQFTSERLQSFYLANPSLAENALRALEEARALEPLDSSGSCHPLKAAAFRRNQ